MNDPRRHHYNPEFCLGEWTAPDGLLCEIKKAYGKVEVQPKSPRATGFDHDLYRTDGVSDEQALHVEKNFMSPLDNDAARALQKIVSGDRTEWSGKERTACNVHPVAVLPQSPASARLRVRARSSPCAGRS